MATPPGSSTGNLPAPAAEALRSIPTPFLTKTYQIVDDPAIDDVISWNEDGSAFVVWNPSLFASDLLPKYFKHNNLSSFVRQLNTYGFRKVAPDRWEFANDSFRKGEKHLLCDIRRRKVPLERSLTQATASGMTACTEVTVAAIPIAPVLPISPTCSNEEQVISNSPPLAIPTASVGVGGNSSAGFGCSSNSTTNGGSDLVDENERLRRENLQLNRELVNMKNLCSNIFTLMSNYAGPQSTNQGGGAGTSFPEADMLRRLDLLPREAGSETAVEPSVGSPTRLFGFEIGTKRSREESDSGGSLDLD